MQRSCLVQVQGHLGGCNPAVIHSCSYHKGRLEGAVLPNLLTRLLEVPSPSSGLCFQAYSHGCWKSTAPHHVGPSTGCVTNGQLTSARASNWREEERERESAPQRSHNLFITYPWKWLPIISAIFHLLKVSQEIQCTFQQRELHKGVSTRRWGHGGPP